MADHLAKKFKRFLSYFVKNNDFMWYNNGNKNDRVLQSKFSLEDEVR